MNDPYMGNYSSRRANRLFARAPDEMDQEDLPSQRKRVPVAVSGHMCGEEEKANVISVIAVVDARFAAVAMMVKAIRVGDAQAPRLMNDAASSE